MNIQKTQNISFQAKLNVPNKSDAQNVFIKNICPILETCGGENITHEIAARENGLAAMVFSIFSPEQGPKFRTFKLIENENINKKIEELKIWIDSVTKQAKN